MKIILCGLAGSGKGTQASLLSSKYSIPVIASGEILRERIKINDDLGNEINSIISRGELVSDELVCKMVREKIYDRTAKNGYVLDGFPRNTNQVEELEKWLKADNSSVDAVIVLNIDEEIVFKRITGRFQCSKCKKQYNKYFVNLNTKVDGVCDICGSTKFEFRDDDVNFEVIKKRFSIFKELSNFVIDYYNKQNIIIKVNADQTPDKVYNDILLGLENVKNKKGV